MKKWSWGFIFFLVVASANAGNAVLTWTNPTGKEVCTNVTDPLEQAGTRIWQLVADINDITVTTATITGLLPGDYSYISTAYDVEGIESRVSGSATKTVEPLTVAVETVYTIVKTEEGFFALPTSDTVPVGTACDINNTVNGLYAVPRAAVVWAGVPKRQVVVAECS